MKYANELTDEELTDLYKSFLGEDDKFVDLTITRDENSIALEGHIKIPDDEEDAIDGMIEIDEDYEITDYNIKAFHHSGSMTLEELRKIYEELNYPVDMVYYKDDDEYYLSSDGNHRTLTAMLLGAQNIRAYVTVEYCNKEKREKYLAEQAFYRKYNISEILVSYSGYKIIFIENNTYFEADGYEKIKYNEDCYSVIKRLSNEIEKDRKYAEIYLKFPNKFRNVIRILLKEKRYFEFIEKRPPSEINCGFVRLCDF